MADADCTQEQGHDQEHWDHIRETVKMLNLAVARLQHTMVDSDNNVDTLTESFTALAQSIESMRGFAADLSDGKLKDQIIQNGEAVSSKVNMAVVAFQFYDKLVQRITHIEKSLHEMSTLMDNPSRLHKPYEWTALQEMIRARYTLDSDKAMFESLMQGQSVSDVLAQFSKTEDDKNDIELF